MEPAGHARVERRLAAILAADVAGYSRLIGADEGGTLKRLKALRRELIDPKIAEEHGGVFAADGHQLFERASALDPQSVEAQNRLGAVLAAVFRDVYDSTPAVR